MSIKIRVFVAKKKSFKVLKTLKDYILNNFKLFFGRNFFLSAL